MIQQPPTDLTPDDPKKLPGASPVAPAPTPAPVPAPAANVTPATPPAITANPTPPNPGVSAAPAAPAVNNLPAASPAPTSNPAATPTNPFNGMYSAEGGTFGGPIAAAYQRDIATNNPNTQGGQQQYALNTLSSLTGVDPSKFGFGATTSLADIQRAYDAMGRIASGQGEAFLNDANPFIAQTAQAYFQGRGSNGINGPVVDVQGSPGNHRIDWPQPAEASAVPGDVTPAALPSESAVPSNAGLTPNAMFGSGPSVAPPQMGNVETQGSPDKAAAMLRAPSSPMSRTDVGGQQSAAPSAMSNLPAASAVGNVGATPTTADNALTNQTLSRAPGADRFKIAQDQYDAAVKAGEPAFQASLRDAMRRAAAGGAIGSGALQSSLGDVVSNRQNGLDAARQGFLADALRGTIADQFGDVGIAQQQQGFQQGQQQQAFGNAVTQRQLEDQLTNSGFSRALQQLLAGSSGSPADLQLALSSIFGQQAASAGAGAAGLFGQAGQNAGGGGSWQQLLDWFKNGGTQAVPNANPTFGPITTTPRTPNLGIGY